MIQIGIIEDDDTTRRYISEFLNLQENMACEASWDNAEAFLENIHQYQHLDILLLDINLPKMLGIEAIKPIKDTLPEVEIIMLTIQSNSEMVFNALCSGATGYLLKTTSLGGIVEAIQLHYKGGAAITPSIARMVLRSFQNNRRESAGNSPQISQIDPKIQTLTPRELEVLELLVAGKSYKMTAAELNISSQTLPVHVRNIYRKLQVNSKAEAIAIYNKHFWRG